MKKKLACLVLAVAMLLVAVPSVAEGFSLYYNAGTVYHSFRTTQYLEKNSNKVWTTITESNSSSIYTNMNTGAVETSYHKTKLVDYSGSSFSSVGAKNVASGATATWTEGIPSISSNTIKLKIYNRYGDDIRKLSTVGNGSGTAMQGS